MTLWHWAKKLKVNDACLANILCIIAYHSARIELLSELTNQQIIECFKLHRLPSCTQRPVATIIQLEYQWNKWGFLFRGESAIKQGFQCIQWIGKLRYKIHKTITQRIFCDGFHFNYFTILAKLPNLSGSAFSLQQKFAGKVHKQRQKVNCNMYALVTFIP